ncbi:D-alanyl-D-alanine carboxypeptidase/D-alanyl-D-alanine endopeptidase [Labedella endophytica]|uniref:D-alanyl-D-alanine carboxypeptidase/D-alanyl-D-alanine-endopeptidase n=1 Tax=Labedella endophytica TaxID=1523160 RepID=A0A433JVV6_9MICO|nr:D-alanyl-D-alanine carboxypeptidase/D-alanyl-D-alanine-endopeptidase [Labedella endophytica]RUR03270.1 D-alanyl-D-alanine carboxypeptidase/D-alanyl-D-alanine-endopeptidase [Labedella endophytica]
MSTRARTAKRRPTIKRRRRRAVTLLVGTAILGAVVVGAISSFGPGAGDDADARGDGAPIELFAGPPEDCAGGAVIDGWTEGTLHLDVRDVESGEPVREVRSEDPAPTGSTMKLLTAAAAVTSLGPDTTLQTRVVQGDDPGTVVLVGGGDPTLSRLPSGQDGVYPGAPHLDELAAQVLDARAADPRLRDEPIVRLDVDASLFGGSPWLDSWPESARTSGSVSNITAVMVDGDRDDPTNAYSRRGEAAVDRAAQAFAKLLGKDVSVGPLVEAPSDAAELGIVRSAPVRELVAHLLTHSDNTLAESLARLVAVDEGTGNDFSAVQAGTTAALDRLGLSTDGLVLADGSGLSSENAVPAGALSELLVEVARGAGDLAIVDDGLAVAGQSGTLAEDGRFSGETADAAGHLRAKSGTLTGMSGLAGIAEAADGSTVAFTIWAEDLEPGAATTTARDAVDTLAAEVYRCGASL